MAGISEHAAEVTHRSRVTSAQEAQSLAQQLQAARKELEAARKSSSSCAGNGEIHIQQAHPRLHGVPAKRPVCQMDDVSSVLTWAG